MRQLLKTVLTGLHFESLSEAIEVREFFTFQAVSASAVMPRVRAPDRQREATGPS
jgi:hypothetical protein